MPNALYLGTSCLLKKGPNEPVNLGIDFRPEFEQDSLVSERKDPRVRSHHSEFDGMSFFSNFKQFIPEAWCTMQWGISRDLNPSARHPRGNFLSQVIKKCLH